MSHGIVAEILLYSQAKGNAKLLLLIIGHHAHDDGTNAYPSLRRLQQLSGLAFSTVELLVKDLAAQGHTILEPGKGPQGQNLYTVLRPWHTTDAPTISTPILTTPSVSTPTISHKQNRKREPFQSAAPEHPASVHRPSAPPDPPQAPAKQHALMQLYGVTNPDILAATGERGSTWHVPGAPVPGAYKSTPCPKHHPDHIDVDGKSWRVKRGKVGVCYWCSEGKIIDLDHHRQQEAT